MPNKFMVPLWLVLAGEGFRKRLIIPLTLMSAEKTSADCRTKVKGLHLRNYTAHSGRRDGMRVNCDAMKLGQEQAAAQEWSLFRHMCRQLATRQMTIAETGVRLFVSGTRLPGLLSCGDGSFPLTSNGGYVGGKVRPDLPPLPLLAAPAWTLSLCDELFPPNQAVSKKGYGAGALIASERNPPAATFARCRRPLRRALLLRPRFGVGCLSCAGLSTVRCFCRPRLCMG